MYFNFGEYKGGVLVGSVYVDENHDGKRGRYEAGRPDVVVTLTGKDDYGTVKKTVKTNKDGNYEFKDLRPGTYTITETQPKGYADGKDTLGTAGGEAGNDVFKHIKVDGCTEGKDYNFGEKPNKGHGDDDDDDDDDKGKGHYGKGGDDDDDDGKGKGDDDDDDDGKGHYGKGGDDDDDDKYKNKKNHDDDNGGKKYTHGKSSHDSKK